MAILDGDRLHAPQRHAFGGQAQRLQRGGNLWMAADAMRGQELAQQAIHGCTDRGGRPSSQALIEGTGISVRRPHFTARRRPAASSR